MSDVRPAGAVMLDVRGTRLAPEEKALLDHPAVGGVILFSRNYESPEQVAELVAEMRAARAGDLLVAVDQEGGRVQRFRAGFTPLPAAAAYWRAAGGDVAQAEAWAREAGWLMAAEVLAVGVDFSFAPVLDVDAGISQIIGDRAFAQDAALATRLAGAFMAGMHEAGMPVVGKHFPGHGGVAADSHLALPSDGRSWEALWQTDLLPYRQLVSLGLDAVMPAHVVYPALDPQPAGFSRYWLQEVLRGRLGFDGVIFSDDLSMEGAAAAGDYAERARLALEAGCDMVLVCNNPAAARTVLESLDGPAAPASARRLTAMRGRAAVSWERLQQTPRRQRAVERLQALSSTPSHT